MTIFTHPGRLPQIALFVVVALLCTFRSDSRAQPTEVVNDRQVAYIAEWFSAWELVSTDIYGVDQLRPVDFVFFDSKYVYTTTDVGGADSIYFDGPRLLNHEYEWRFAEHHGTLVLPDGSSVRTGLMSFAAPAGENSAHAFFVMPLPDYWETANVTSDELGLANLLVGVFLHEFSHSQQMHNFGKQISDFERIYGLGDELTDDIVQDTFEHDDRYTNDFRDEVDLFYQAANANGGEDRLALSRRAMDSYRNRQNRYFTGDHAFLRELDDFFLTMEGFGQYTMYAWLTHPKGGALDIDVAEAGVRRGGRWWSQEQGLALFLLLQEYSNPKDWSDKMFGEDYEVVTRLIDAGIAAN